MTARLKSARLSNSSAVESIDDAVAALESSLAELMGLNLDQDYSGSVLGASGNAYDFATVSDAATLSNFSTYTPFSLTRTIGAGALNTVGKVCRIRATGEFTSTTGAATNFLLRCRFGASTPVFDSDRVASHNIGADIGGTGHWELDVELVTRSTGATGTVRPSGRLITMAPTDGPGISLNFYSAPITLDLTATQLVVIAAFFTTGNAGRTAKMRSFNIEIGQAGATA